MEVLRAKSDYWLRKYVRFSYLGSNTERLRHNAPMGILQHNGKVWDFVHLNKATYIELLFDLVLIFCMRSILPVLTEAESGVVDWCTYYTFCFTFVLMLQIWFNSTVMMNRFGTGGKSGVAYLVTDMFLLMGMTRAISVN